MALPYHFFAAAKAAYFLCFTASFPKRPSGIITVLAENGEIRSAFVSCRGSIKIMQSGAPVSLGAKLTFPEEGESLSVPEKAYKALKESDS